MFRYFTLGVFAAGLWAAAAGCSGSTNDKFTPSEGRARQALEAALTAWQEGKKPGPVEGAPMKVEAVDSQWLKGKKLTAYEIISQEPNDGPPAFSVRLTIVGDKEPSVVRYYVVGKDPLWVYREDDYKRSSGM